MLWDGPSPELIASCTNPVASALHARARKVGLCYEANHKGTRVVVSRLEGGNGRHTMTKIDEVEGADPLDTFLNVALKYTDLDDELLRLATTLIEQRIDALSPAFGEAEKRIESVLREITSTLGALRV